MKEEFRHAKSVLHFNVVIFVVAFFLLFLFVWWWWWFLLLFWGVFFYQPLVLFLVVDPALLITIQTPQHHTNHLSPLDQTVYSKKCKCSTNPSSKWKSMVFHFIYGCSQPLWWATMTTQKKYGRQSTTEPEVNTMQS